MSAALREHEGDVELVQQVVLNVSCDRMMYKDVWCSDVRTNQAVVTVCIVSVCVAE